jgi:hypothetical protein
MFVPSRAGAGAARLALASFASSASLTTTPHLGGSSAPSAAALLAALRGPAYQSHARRTYIASPVPSLTGEEVAKLHQGQSRSNSLRKVVIGPRLMREERDELSAAKRRGALYFGPGCTRTVCNEYYRFCWHVQRPYIAVNPHGLVVSLDARPVRGLAKTNPKAEEGRRTFLANASAALAAGGRAGFDPVQVTTDATLLAQLNKILPGPTEGSNAEKEAPVTALTDATPALPGVQQGAIGETSVVSIFTNGRHHASEVAAELYDVYVRTFGLQTPAETQAAREVRAAARNERARKTLVRKLRAVVSDPTKVKLLGVRGGSIEGFVRADAAGKVR